jgi:hypothetical protein
LVALNKPYQITAAFCVSRSVHTKRKYECFLIAAPNKPYQITAALLF